MHHPCALLMRSATPRRGKWRCSWGYSSSWRTSAPWLAYIQSRTLSKRLASTSPLTRFVKPANTIIVFVPFHHISDRFFWNHARPHTQVDEVSTVKTLLDGRYRRFLFLMGCWLLAGSPQCPAPQYCHCGYEDVKSSPTADGLVFFGVWHPSKQPSQVLDLASWTCLLSAFTSYYVVALVRWFWAAQPCNWPGAMCPLHWSSPLSGLYCPMNDVYTLVDVSWQCHARLGFFQLLKAHCRVNFRNVFVWNTTTQSIHGTHQTRQSALFAVTWWQFLGWCLCPVPHQTAVLGTLILIFKLGTTILLVFWQDWIALKWWRQSDSFRFAK